MQLGCFWEITGQYAGLIQSMRDELYDTRRSDRWVLYESGMGISGFFPCYHVRLSIQIKECSGWYRSVRMQAYVRGLVQKQCLGTCYPGPCSLELNRRDCATSLPSNGLGVKTGHYGTLHAILRILRTLILLVPILSYMT